MSVRLRPNPYLPLLPPTAFSMSYYVSGPSKTAEAPNYALLLTKKMFQYLTQCNITDILEISNDPYVTFVDAVFKSSIAAYYLNLSVVI